MRWLVGARPVAQANIRYACRKRCFPISNTRKRIYLVVMVLLGLLVLYTFGFYPPEPQIDQEALRRMTSSR